MNTANRTFKLNFTNICGLKNNKNSVHHHLGSRSPDLLFLTETKLKPGAYLLFHRYQYLNYTLETNFKFQRGLCVFIKRGVKFDRKIKFELPQRTIVLKITLPHVILFIIALYRSPSTPRKERFFEELTNRVKAIANKFPNAKIIVVGDFNVHNDNWLPYSRPVHDPNGKEAEQFATRFGFTQMIKDRTHLPRNNVPGNTLDLYLTQISDSTTVTTEDPLGNSDHKLIVSEIRVA